MVLPNGSVLINSTFADGTNGVNVITFGGSPSLNNTQSSSTFAFNNQLSWFSLDNKHRLKMTTELRRASYTAEQTQNMFGTFRFNSLGEFETGRPAAFTRLLEPRTLSAGQWVAGASLGDSYRVNRDLQLQYGVRVDANRFSDLPDRNEAVETLFGVRNDQVPSSSGSPPGSDSPGATARPADPRLRGCLPRPARRGSAVVSVSSRTRRRSVSRRARSTTPASRQGSRTSPAPVARPRSPIGPPTGSIRRPSPPPAPTARWERLSNARPNVSLFGEDFRPQQSIRGNVQWNGPVLDNRFTATAEVTYSRNRFQQSFIDLNFDATERFALASEGNRPVSCRPASSDQRRDRTRREPHLDAVQSRHPAALRSRGGEQAGHPPRAAHRFSTGLT